MPRKLFRRRTSRMRRSFKGARGYRRAKRTVARRERFKRKRALDTLYRTFKVTGVLDPVQGITVTNYIYRWFPLIDTTGSNGSILRLPDFSLHANLYDRCRINWIKVKVTPRANVLDMGVAQNEAVYTYAGDGLWHTVMDRDGAGPSSIGQLARVGSYQPHSVLKPWSRRYEVKYPKNLWLDTDNLVTDATTQSRPLGLFGGVTFYCENTLEDTGEISNEPFAVAEITYGVVFQGYTGGALKAGAAEGEICVRSIETRENKALSGFTPVHPIDEDEDEPTPV